MLKILETYPNWIIEIDSLIKWQTISIVALTHWNEIVWLEVIKYLINEFEIKKKLKKWKINLIIWNIEAGKLWKRFKDVDLNRVWSFEKKYKWTYEYLRWKELKNILLESDIVLDIHSTKSPSEPFIIPLKWVENKLINSLNAKYVINNLIPFLHWIPLISFVKNNNPLSKCLVIESWQHSSESTIILSIENTLKILEFYWFINENISLNKIEKIHYKIFDVIYAKSLNVKFHYSSRPKSFDEIEKWEKILFDWKNNVLASKDLSILMPSIPEYTWREIWYLMKKIK